MYNNRALLILLYVLTRVFVATYKPSVVFPVSGNVYPVGYYQVTIKIGDPPKEYFLDIDTGSDLTWLQCGIDGATTTPTPHDLYTPVTSADGKFSQVASCMHHICVSLQPNGVPNCGDPQCHYEIQYADGGSSLGVLVFDNVNLLLTNDTTQTALVAIGCGYDQVYLGQEASFVDGILGLGRGKAGILNQLRGFGVMDNIISHCFGAHEGGFLAFGDTPLIDNIVWKTVSTQQNHYMMGSGDLYFDDEANPTSNDLQVVIFDSGSTYTYFSSQAYVDILAKIKNVIGTQLEVANDDLTLPVCWKGAQPFTSVTDAPNAFKTLHLIMTSDDDVARFEMDPKSYLILSDKGNLCLGILNGGEVGIGDEISLIGDISMQDKWIIYENGRVGWAPANCSVAPQFAV